MINKFLLFSFVFLLHSLKSNGQSYWQQQADFDINVSLNDTLHTLDAFETITYKNNSPDTLYFIWFHLWPNAFKNDKTAFSEQMVTRLNNTAFYFSKDNDRGYINKMDFKVNGLIASTEDHPQYIDIAKLILPKPLLPGEKVVITTPFHVKLPKNFSRGGHIDQSYQITQWYPKPAVYDKYGWHTMPYLDQGEFYNDFGNYNVSITLPKNYIVGATGVLQNEDEKQFILNKTQPTKIIMQNDKDIFAKKKNLKDAFPPSDKTVKTITYKANNVIDFAWFADKRFVVQHDTVSLLTDEKIDIYVYILPSKIDLWKNSVVYAKRALKFYSNQMGNYPYHAVSVVCAPENTSEGGMEYPNITLVNVKSDDQKDLDMVITHEIGHNWLQAMIATDERDHAWMDEGMNTYIERKYSNTFYLHKKRKFDRESILELTLESLINQGRDQPIATTSEAFNRYNYGPVIYMKTALWMEKLEQKMGKEKMLQVMHEYFNQWKYKHPYPGDFKKICEDISGQGLNDLFDLLFLTGDLGAKQKLPLKVTTFFPGINTDTKYVTISPIAGYNAYDNLMIGGLIHNIGLPTSTFKFIAAPLYAIGSNSLNFIGATSYSFYKKKYIITPNISFAKFNTAEGIGPEYQKLYKGFSKIVPSFKWEFRGSNNSSLSKWIEWRSFFINEGTFDYKQRTFPQDTFSYYAIKGPSVNRSVHQLSLGIENDRSLYPYKIVTQFQKAGDLLRTTITSNHFFNYNSEQGISLRLFAGKIFYLQSKTDKIKYSNNRYYFTMYGPNGEDDYTYSNPFIERNQNTSFDSRQIMIRDGGFKYRSDFSSNQPGRTDNWLAALNFAFDVPWKLNPLTILPIKIPLKVFADIGTYDEAWKKNNSDPRFLYSMGLQISLLKYFNIYWVLLQSKQFKEPSELNGTKWWQKNVTFSIDVQNIKPVIEGIHLW